MPIEVYAQWKRARADFFARLRSAAETASVAPEEAERLAAEAVAATRADRPGI